MSNIVNYRKWFIGWRPIGAPRAKPEFYERGFDTFSEASVFAQMGNATPSGTHHFITTTFPARFIGGRKDGQVINLPPCITEVYDEELNSEAYVAELQALETEKGVDNILIETPASDLEEIMGRHSTLHGIYKRTGYDEEQGHFVFTLESDLFEAAEKLENSLLVLENKLKES